jgi:adenylosuccinate lyase
MMDSKIQIQEEINRTKELMDVLSEQRTMTVNGVKVTREEYYDYILRNYMHIRAKSGTFGEEYEYNESYTEDLTDEEKELYCKLLSDEFLVTYDIFDTEPFEGDATC